MMKPFYSTPFLLLKREINPKDRTVETWSSAKDNSQVICAPITGVIIFIIRICVQIVILNSLLKFDRSHVILS